MGNTKIEKTMKQKNNKPNSPRLANAIKKACAYARDHSGWWTAFHSDDLGILILGYAYGADKYDVLNALCPGIPRKVITYARGDIRHRRTYSSVSPIMLVLLVLLTFFVLKHVLPC